MENNFKLYSQKAIGGSTFLGGPLAAGILIRRNCINLGNDQQGKNALYIGIISTIILFGSMVFIPENIMDKIPNMVIPAIYTAIIYVLVDKFQGVELKDHEQNSGEFYSGWDAAKVGLISLFAILVIIFSVAFIAGDLSNLNFDANKYDQELSVFTDNETESMDVYKLTDDASTETIITSLNKSIDLWKKNIVILNKTDSLTNIPDELIIQNKILLEYSYLRIEHFSLILRSVKEDTDAYDKRVEILGQLIEDKISMLSE